MNYIAVKDNIDRNIRENFEQVIEGVIVEININNAGNK